MNPLTTQIDCEVAGFATSTEVLAEALRAELRVLYEDLGLGESFAVRVHGGARLKERTDVRKARLHVDGEPLDWHPIPSTDEMDALVAALHAQRQELITPRLADQLWEAAGGTAPCPAPFSALLRQLAAAGLQLDRVLAAVPSWQDASALQLFEDALGNAERRLRVYVHPERVPEVAGTLVGKDGRAAMMADGLFYELGVLCGEMVLEEDATLPSDRMRVRINDVRSAPQRLIASDRLLVNDTVDRLTLLNIRGEVWSNPANGSESALVSFADDETCTSAGLTTWDSASYVVLALSAVVRANAAHTLSLDIVRWQLRRLAEAFPAVARHVKEGIGEAAFARVLRSLLNEEITIRNMRWIIETLAATSPAQSEPVDYSKFIVFSASYVAFHLDLPLRPWCGGVADALAEAVRVGHKRYISHKYTRGASTLVVYLLDPKLEERLAQRRPLSSYERRQLLDTVANEFDQLPPRAQGSCILTTMEVRRRLRVELEQVFHKLVVLSYQELSPEMNIQPIARISLEDVGFEPLDAVDKAFAELRYADAQQSLAAVAADAVGPLPWFEARLFELLFFWNEAGKTAKLTENLQLWASWLPTEQQADIASMLERPEPAAIRQWMRARDRWRLRRLQAAYLPRETDLLKVEGGAFAMGSRSDAATAARNVKVSDFFIAPLPVTARQFSLYLQAHDIPVRSSWVTAEEAARGVRFSEAIAYCNWLSERANLAQVYQGPETDLTCNHSRAGFRLPTEAEWEYAARGGRAAGGYRYAGSDRLVEVGDARGVEPVGLYISNELGIHDMSGGRAEWCWDWFADDYGGVHTLENPMGPPQGVSRVCRGGDSTGAGDARACTVYAREGVATSLDSHSSMNIGFRVARSV